MNSELLAMLEYIEQERDIDRNTVYRIVEEALAVAARKEYPDAEGLHVEINRKSGDITTFAKYTAVDKVDDPETEKTVDELKSHFDDVELGEEYSIKLSISKSLSRIGAQSTKQAILQRLRAYEKERVRDEYADLIGELIMGTIRHFDKGDVYIDFGRAEGILPASEKLPTEDYQNGDHITVYLSDVNDKKAGASLIVSRANPNLVRRLFEREVSEINEGIVDIKSIAREPGFRTKVAVASNDSRVDPVGACVGIRGARVKAIVRELNREKIDIVHWNEDIRKFVAEALKPAEFIGISADEDTKTVTVYTTEEQYSLAIGRKGQNARLTSKLTGWDIDIQKKEPEAEVTIQDKIKEVIEIFSSIPGVSEEIAGNLVNNGYISLDGIAGSSTEDLASIEGIDEETAEQIISYTRNKILP